MKKMVFFMSICLCMITLKVSAAPVIFIKTPDISIQPMPRHFTKNFAITIQNTGDEDLLINEVKISCDCITILSHPDRLNPRQEGTIECEFYSSDYEGNIRRLIQIITNDPDKPISWVDINATVFKEYLFEPEHLSFNNTISRLGNKKSFIIHHYKKEKISISSITGYDDTIFDVKMDTSLQQQVKVDVRIKKGAPAGSVNQQMKISFDSPSKKELDYYISGFIYENEFLFRPDSLTFDSENPNGSGSRLILLTNRTATPFKLGTIKNKHEKLFKITSKQLEAHMYRFDVSVLADKLERGKTYKIPVSIKRGNPIINLFTGKKETVELVITVE